MVYVTKMLKKLNKNVSKAVRKYIRNFITKEISNTVEQNKRLESWKQQGGFISWKKKQEHDICEQQNILKIIEG